MFKITLPYKEDKEGTSYTFNNLDERSNLMFIFKIWSMHRRYPLTKFTLVFYSRKEKKQIEQENEKPF